MTGDLTVTRLSTTPVKGLSLHHPRSIALNADGAVGDRLFFLVDEAGKLQSCTHHSGLYGLRATYDDQERRLRVGRGGETLLEAAVEASVPVDTDLHGVRTIRAAQVADPVWSAFFSDAVGRRVHLMHAGGPVYDVRPATLLGTASVEELARRAHLPEVDARRFRMLIEFSGGTAHVEDSWAGMLIGVGDTVLRAAGRVKRCAATTRDPDTGRVDLQTLRMINGYRDRQQTELGVGTTFGIYADVVEPGTVSVGDPLVVHGRPSTGGPDNQAGSPRIGRPATAEPMQSAVEPK
ncbi:MOSC domain-containing protein [Nocardioides hungaricus]